MTYDVPSTRFCLDVVMGRVVHLALEVRYPPHVRKADPDRRTQS
jgi:hypothetical protein